MQILIALMTAGVKKGDEVITTSNTVPTVSAIVSAGQHLSLLILMKIIFLLM